MFDFLVALIGYVGDVAIAVAMIPMVLRVLKNKSARDISMLFLIIDIFGSACLTTYGILTANMVMFALNAFMVLIFLVMIALKLFLDKHFDKKQ